MELEWEEFHCTEKMNYFDALDYLRTVSDDGWRLPTNFELTNACKNYMEGFQRWGYWSGDFCDDKFSFIIYFYTANEWKVHKDSLMYVRFVKDIE
jgi:hypothetical protein